MKLHIYDTDEKVIKALANFFVTTVNAAIRKNDECAVVLSGGNSPKKLYQLLVSDDYKSQLDWSKVSFFFGDERYVPFNYPDNNGLMAKETLFEPLKIDESKIFYIGTSLSPEHDAANYTDNIFTYFGERQIKFDLILLGLGDNAHTASLFPYTDVLHEEKAIVRPVFLEEQDVYRITMTAPLINEAHKIAFLVYGKNKAEAVQQVLKGEKNIELYPAQLIQPLDGTVNWFMDAAAAKGVM
ncbi:MAG: 6-phosphogluconolactonase [Bacteroidota bacterium]